MTGRISSPSSVGDLHSSKNPLDGYTYSRVRGKERKKERTTYSYYPTPHMLTFPPPRPPTIHPSIPRIHLDHSIHPSTNTQWFRIPVPDSKLSLSLSLFPFTPQPNPTQPSLPTYLLLLLLLTNPIPQQHATISAS